LVHTRKLSREETEKGFLFITKRFLKESPPTGKVFKIKINGGCLNTRVVAVSCTCRGPNKPHEHFHTPLKILNESEEGDAISISRNIDRGYLLVCV